MTSSSKFTVPKKGKHQLLFDDDLIVSFDFSEDSSLRRILNETDPNLRKLLGIKAERPGDFPRVFELPVIIDDSINAPVTVVLVGEIDIDGNFSKISI